ncbi:MAG: peptide chain release factor N(5)-glutamine methyltransferase [Gemmataceae bacterium]
MALAEQPWTVARLLEWTTAHFASKKTDSPRLEAEILLAQAMGCKRIELYVRHEEIPGEEVRDRFRGLVRRRALGEPVAYLVGYKEFYSLSFRVSPAVLIPRPDTETLVDQALSELKSKAFPMPKLLDLGTGSGCLAIVLAKLIPTLAVTAVDLFQPALDLARLNAQTHKVGDRVQFLLGDLFCPLKPAESFDLIVSNPPYIPTADIATLESSVRDFEPKSALDGGADGLDFYRRILQDASSRLNLGGSLMMEVGFDQAQSVLHLARDRGFEQVATVPDRNRVPRVIVAKK